MTSRSRHRSASIPQGSRVAVPTPFRNGAIDDGALGRLCDRQIRRSSIGEAPALSPVEHAHAIRITVETAAERVSVVAGCGTPATASAVFLASEAERAGADAMLCSPPPCSRPTQDGIIAHVGAGFARIRDLLAPLNEALFLDSDPIPVKAALAGLGPCSAEMRLRLLADSGSPLERIDALHEVLADEEHQAAVASA